MGFLANLDAHRSGAIRYTGEFAGFVGCVVFDLLFVAPDCCPFPLRATLLISGLFFIELFWLSRPDFPTMQQVESASHEELGRWYRFLPSVDSPEQQKIMDRIEKRFKKLGGMTSELSDKIGYGGSGSAGYRVRQ